MLLDRNASPDGKSKYAIVCLRKIEGNPQTPQELAVAILKNPEAVDFGKVGSDGEFFVLRLKDAYAPVALNAYADCAEKNDEEYAAQIRFLANRAAGHPDRKHPD